MERTISRASADLNPTRRAATLSREFSADDVEDKAAFSEVREIPPHNVEDKAASSAIDEKPAVEMTTVELSEPTPRSSFSSDKTNVPSPRGPRDFKGHVLNTVRILKKFGKFVGPGFMVSVAYIDPGNYATDVAAGSTFRFDLLFIILMSNMFAIFLQSLCTKLGTVTGLNLAQQSRAHMPKYLNLFLYVLAETAIIATDIAEVIGSAIALNLLFKIPLVAGCLVTMADTFFILIFYNPSGGSMKGLRAFEVFVMVLVLGVVISFCIQLSLIRDTKFADVIRGYLPSSSIVQTQGLFQSCGILGATVMPHSLYLGSGIVQSRLQEFDKDAGIIEKDFKDDGPEPVYRPSLMSINYCLPYSIAEIAISLFTFALFVNSSILITAGASLNGNDGASDADLFGIYTLLSKSIAPIAGTIFALALLLSGTSAGIVATIAGQIVSEGAIQWSVKPWIRRTITRAISILPSVIIAAAVGKEGLNETLLITQVMLSVSLPFVSAPLIWFTSKEKYMRVSTDDKGGFISMVNSKWTTGVACVIWLIMAVMNMALLVLVALGEA